MPAEVTSGDPTFIVPAIVLLSVLAVLEVWDRLRSRAARREER